MGEPFDPPGKLKAKGSSGGAKKLVNWLNKLRDAFNYIHRSINVESPLEMLRTKNRITIRLTSVPGEMFDGRITGKVEFTDEDGFLRGLYSFIEIEWNTIGTWHDKSGGRFGVALEINRSNANIHLAAAEELARSNIVRLWKPLLVPPLESVSSSTSSSSSASASTSVSSTSSAFDVGDYYLFDKGLTNTPPELREEV